LYNAISEYLEYHAIEELFWFLGDTQICEEFVAVQFLADKWDLNAAAKGYITDMPLNPRETLQMRCRDLNRILAEIQPENASAAVIALLRPNPGNAVAASSM
jgi:hypothetical protein